MTREIKFRAWDVNKSEMVYEDFSVSYKGTPHDIHGFRNLELMQFTGLLDKNGTEIYEGDIVEMRDGSRNPYTVIWADSFNGFGLDGVPGGLQILLKEYVEDLTIIGNIYSNPELLAVK